MRLPVRAKNRHDPVGWVILDAEGNVVCPYTLRPAADEIVAALNRPKHEKP